MRVETTYFLVARVVGGGATLVLDLWVLFLKRAFNLSSSNYCWVGRWLYYMTEGTFRHVNIAAAPAKRCECRVGWIAYYVMGVVFALVFIVLASGDWLARPTRLPALLFGISTVLIPFLIMHPSFGLGIAASKTPNPPQARLRSLLSHTVFGVGLYLCAVGVSDVLPVYP